MSIVRPHNFYGPRSGHHVIPDVIERIGSRIDPFVVPGFDETRSFCYIEDAIEAMQMVMESTVTDFGTYHIGASVETKVRDLVEALFRITKWHPTKVGATPGPAGSVKRRLPDVTKIKRDVGWEAKTPLEEGLRKTYEWHLSNIKSTVA
jgi:nucleoside-diphosphate-sugar epimerase